MLDSPRVEPWSEHSRQRRSSCLARLPPRQRRIGRSFISIARRSRRRFDGVLDDEVWQRPPLALGEWLSYNPNRGDRMPPRVPRTDVRIAYDDRNLYFAFHCFDNEPDKIRTKVSQPRPRVQRRLDGHQPRFRRHRTDRVSPLLESERQPDGRAQHVRVRRAVRRRHGLVQRRQDAPPTATWSKCRSRCRRFDSRAATT